MYDTSSAVARSTSQWYVIGASFLAYLAFKLCEPEQPREHAALLFGVPVLLSAVLYQVTSRFWYSLSLGYGGYWMWLVVFTTMYRLSPFHPLAAYPGPAMARVSKLWMTYKLTKGKVHVYVRELHEHYGDIVRVGPNELSIRHADAVLPAYGTKGLHKGPFYSGRVQPNGTMALLNISDPVEHAARRRTWNRGMNSAALKGYEVIIREKVQDLLDGLSQRQSQRLDISEWMSFFGFDFMGRMAFGKDFNMLKAGRDEGGVWHILEKGTLAFCVISYLPWLGRWVMKLPQKSSAIAMLRNIAGRHVEQRVKQGSQHRDLFHYLIDEDGIDEQKPTMPIVLSDGVLAVIGGADTTSTALSNLWYFLLQNPDAYKRLRQEIDTEFPLGSDPFDFTKHADMPYLNACINESLRLLPPVLSGSQRSTYNETTVLGPFVVPAHTAICIPTYTLHRDARCFSPLPDVFWPERWFTQDKYKLPTGQTISSSQLVHNRDAYLPFSFGPANCVGKKLALMEIRAVTAAFLQKFDMQVAEDYDLIRWEADIMEYGVTSRGSLFVKLTARF